MGTPSIAHYGTTIIEAEPPKDVPLNDAPVGGDLKKALRFFEIMGFKPLMENMYEGVGRQYIWNRGTHSDVDYVEVDSFTSFRAVKRPSSDNPRVGDTIFRLTHADPQAIYRQWCDEGLAHCLASPQAESAFLDGKSDWVLLQAAHGQAFEFGPTQLTRAGNNAVYIWTDPDAAEDIAADYRSEFGMTDGGSADFHGKGESLCLQRATPGITVGLLTPKAGGKVEPRWSEDIFVEAGYSHYRLGSPDKNHTLTKTREAFPDGGGDVSYVYYHDSYLELVQVDAEDPACAA